MALALIRARSAARPLSSLFVQRAAFTASAGRLSGKEDELRRFNSRVLQTITLLMPRPDTDKESRAAHVEKKKTQSIKSHWEEDLASNSESIVYLSSLSPRISC
jgi:hypothetical protein